MNYRIRPLKADQIKAIANRTKYKEKISKELVDSITTMSSLITKEGMQIQEQAIYLSTTLANRLPKSLESVGFCSSLAQEFLSQNLEALYLAGREGKK
ncbi:hypothetical protein VBY75_11805 [Idiomarina sp. HB]|uniref:hypothetical protein n=1 Tax=Idiomarina sp. HB TaxID=3110479 RepID=UPI003A7F7968